MKLSQWHDGSVKPVHVGLYQVKGDCRSYDEGWAVWSGKYWEWNAAEKHKAILFFKNGYGASGAQKNQWRGIVK